MIVRLSRAPRWRGLATVLLAMWAAIAGVVEADDTGAAMHEIFQSMRYLLPLSVGDEWQDTRNAERVRAELAAVAERASLLAEHARSERHDFRLLGRTLASDLREVRERYERAEYESARYLLLHATNYCVTCHVRLPARNDSPLSAQFIDATVLAELPLEQRAHLEVATRRFDDALVSFESLLLSDDRHATELMGVLSDYLIVSIRVKRDLDRALTALERFGQRPDLWVALQDDVQHWLATLRQYRGRRMDPPTLALGTELMREATANRRYVADRRSLINYVLASAVLHRYVESVPPRHDLAKAYYLLGLGEFQIGRDYWIARGEMFLETAIRLAPEAPVAADAYALLEQEVLLGYTGSAGLSLPEDEARRLAELRALIESGRRAN